MKRRPALRLGLALVLLLGLVLSRGPPAHGQDDPLDAATERVTQAIDQGRLLDATAALVQGFATLPAAQLEPWFSFAARTCVSLGSIACGVAVLEQPFVLSFAPDRIYPQTAGALILLTAWVDAVTGNENGARRLADNGIPSGLATPLSNPVLFAELSLLAAQQTRRANKFAASRGYLDRALAATLSLQGERREATGLVLRIVRQHIANYDAERALRLFAAAEALFAPLPRTGLAYADFLALRAELHGYRGDLAAASNDLGALILLLRDLQIEAGVREARRAEAYTQMIAIQVLRGNHDLAAGLLRLHPLAPRRAEIGRRGQFANATEFWFAVMEEFILGDGAGLAGPGWRALLEQPVGWAGSDDEREHAEAYARTAASLNRLRRDDPGARADLLEAARQRLATLYRLQRQSVFASPLPSWPDRLLLQIAATATLATARPDLDLLLGVHIVQSRSLQSRADDTLASLARYRTESGRRAVQGLYTTDLQRMDWETAQLEALGKRLAEVPGPSSPATTGQRAAILAAAGDFAKQQRSLRAALVTLPGGPPDGSRGGVRALQHQLHADEALLFYVPLLDGRLGKVCLRRDQVASGTETVTQADGAEADRLMAALLSDALPVAGAAPFPVTAAVRLDRLLLGGLDACLPGARRVFYVPPNGLPRFPPAALLPETPPLRDDGPDLRAARWRVRDHAFVHTNSISAFLAARRLAGTRTAPLDYLGIGDPVLPRAGIGSALPDLPEASQELQAAAALFAADRTRLLRRTEATEQRLRDAPAGAYDILHVATHGLTREDLPDLEEPGLVLAAGPTGDGFLPASRIATLPLRARLVVLSACNSAHYDGLLTDRGIQGLATAFTLAGVPAMIAALWPVESALARDTIVATFRRARADGDAGIADALAEAVRRHLDGPTPRPLLHPRFWASLVVLGDGAMSLAPAPR